jgi:V-type H+-transporting ATPase subunit a
MGVFAIYVGILYNDCFGFSVELFSSAYRWPRLPETTTDEHGVAHHTSGAMGTVRPLHPNGHPSVKPLHTYPFGIDVAWAETENKLEFYNSTKMKCAVIIGVIQMLAGIVLSLLNHLRKRDWRHVWFGFVPEFVFLSCTFGYMALLIMVKWVTPWENTNLAPSLLETMTNFFLAPGVVTLPVFAGQAHLQVLLLLLAFSMVPLLLCAIPYLELRDHRAAVAAERLLNAGDDEEVELSVLPAPREEEEEDDRASSEATAAAAAGEGHFDFSEVMIHYIIHTIEFVLGAVSNTASYLRLWALSLAHAQLSEVFLNFALVASIGADSGNGLTLYVGFALWLGATIGVLLGMESLSAFLHALRLHWVEFNGKFYAGDGKAFTPLKLAEVTAVA